MWSVIPSKAKDRVVLFLAALGLLCAFLFIRLNYLNSLPVFVDEAIYVRWSQVMRSEPTLRFVPLSDGKQPLYMWLTIPAFKLISDPLVAGRVVSVFAGLGTLAGIVVLASVLLSSLWWGLLAGVVYTLLPFAHFFDRMALADGVLSFFGVWSLVLGYLLVRYPRLDLAMILGFSVGGAVLTKSPGWFFLLLQPVLLLIQPPLKGKGANLLSRIDWRRLGTLVFFWGVAGVIAFGLYNILRLGPNFQMIALRNKDYIFPFNEVLAHPLNPFTGNSKNTISWLVNLLTPAAALLILASLLYRHRNIWALWLWALLPLLAQAGIAKAYTSRYFFFVTPVLAVLITVGLREILALRKEIAYLLAAMFLVSAARYDYLLSVDPARSLMPQNMAHGYLQEWTSGWGQREVGAYLVERAKSHSVVAGTDGFFGTLPDGLQIYTEKVPHLTVIGVGIAMDKIPIQLEQSLAENETYLVINASRNKFPGEILRDRLELIAEYPKAVRPDGTRESLQFYRLLR